VNSITYTSSFQQALIPAEYHQASPYGNLEPAWNPLPEQLGRQGSGYNGQYISSSDFASNEGTYGYRGSYNAAREFTQDWTCVLSRSHFPLCLRSDTFRFLVNAECLLFFNTVLTVLRQSLACMNRRDILMSNRHAEDGIAWVWLAWVFFDNSSLSNNILNDVQVDRNRNSTTTHPDRQYYSDPGLFQYNWACVSHSKVRCLRTLCSHISSTSVVVEKICPGKQRFLLVLTCLCAEVVNRDKRKGV